MQMVMDFQAANAVLEISHALHDINDFHEFPLLLESAITKYRPIDWMGLYRISSHDPRIQITKNPHLPFNWDEMYQEIARYDNFAASTFALDEGSVLIFRESHDTMDEKNFCALEFAKRHTDTEHFLGLIRLKTADTKLAYGFYRSDKRNPFLNKDKEFFIRLSPIIVAASKMMELYRDHDFKRAALDSLLADEPIRPVVFDQNLRPSDVSQETLQAIAKAHGQNEIPRLPKEIRDWIFATVAPKGRLVLGTGPFFLRLHLPNGDLCCRASIIKTRQERLVLLIRFTLHESTEDFSVLRIKSLTPREITALEYLPLGYSNRQIAMAMGIEEVSVKKHLKNAARKLCAANRAETLCQAMFEKSILLSSGLR